MEERIWAAEAAIEARSSLGDELLVEEQLRRSAMEDSQFLSWKEPYRQALTESDEQKLVELVRGAECAIFLRLQELENSTDHQEERIQMKRAAADLLAIKTYKLGWPDPRG